MTSRSVPVDIRGNEKFNFIVLTEVIRVIETEAGLDQLLLLGLTPELIDTLRTRQTRDLMDLASRMRSIRITLAVNEIAGHLDGIDRQRRDDEMCEYFVRNGATRSLVTRLFKRSSDEVRRLRDLLGGASVGRTKLPKEHDVVDHIHIVWHEIRRNAGPAENLRDWLFALHQKFPDYSIDSLHTCVKEYESFYGSDDSNTSQKALGNH
ncbi:STY4526/YPO1902 family pathogenicity island replication protein [Delftia sp. GW456-R20]|uniref:STY4526/YPO1902 family pathogenicity island replication protein n=1 Tax=Delftia sp. GW456-R20 TaxID=1827145 RepID=UPI0009EEBA83|nr:STY4526/YPO1902 family pathogenicity island replication protein [Delftia sp. GW456-R20]